MRITQQDIARLASVSQATVSRVLAGDARVENDIRDRVMAVVREHNYQPDVRARSLRSQQSGLIGLVVKRPTGGLNDDPFFANLIAQIMDYLAGTPYHLCVEMVSSPTSQEAVYDELLRTRRVDGLILVESEARDERIPRLQLDQFPFVLIGNSLLSARREEDTIWSVDNDNIYAGEVATRHLHEQGYEKVGILAGPYGVTVSEDRIIGYQRAAKAARGPEMIWHSDFGLEAARQSAREILAGPDAPDALVVLDDFMAVGVVLAARDLDIHVPDELGIVGFNDSFLSQLVDGGLTSVSLDIPQIVRLACGRLLKIIEDTPIEGDRRQIVDCSLKARGSSRRRAAVGS
jgi:DNA-binding LacI/PurR family transcriptional regulator